MKSSHFNLNNIPASIEDTGYSLTIRLLAAAVFASLVVLTGCKNDDGNLKSDRVRKLLTANTWTMKSVTVDGADRTSLHTGLTLHFTNNHYTTTHGGVLWPASDIWTFANDTGTMIVRGDEIELAIQKINATELVLTFTWMETTLGPGRLSSTSGEHVFSFVK